MATVPDKKLTAKERKERAAERSREATKKAPTNHRRAGKVTKYVSPKAKRKPGRPKLSAAFAPKMATPKGLSAEARFDMLRPDCVSPRDWFSLFHVNESIWPMIVDEAIEAVKDGELAEYPEDGAANVSRRKLRELRGDVA